MDITKTKAWEYFKHIRAYHTFGSRWVGMASMGLSVFTAVGVWFQGYSLFSKMGIIFGTVVIANTVIAYVGYLDTKSGCLECEMDKLEKSSPLWKQQMKFNEDRKNNEKLIINTLNTISEHLGLETIPDEETFKR